MPTKSPESIMKKEARGEEKKKMRNKQQKKERAQTSARAQPQELVESTTPSVTDHTEQHDETTTIMPSIPTNSDTIDSTSSARTRKKLKRKSKKEHASSDNHVHVRSQSQSQCHTLSSEQTTQEPPDLKKSFTSETKNRVDVNVNMVPGLNDAMMHPRRDMIRQQKQQHKLQSSQNRNSKQLEAMFPGAYAVTASVTPSSAPSFPATDQTVTEALVYSVGTEVARQRQIHKDHKQRSSARNAPLSETRNPLFAAHEHAPKPTSSKSGLHRNSKAKTAKANSNDGHRNQPPPPPPPPTLPPSNGGAGADTGMDRRQPDPLMNQRDSTPDLISAQLVVDFDDELQISSQQEETIYQQAHRDAERQVREDLLRDVVVAKEVFDEENIKRKQCRTWTAVSGCVVILVAILAGVLGAQPWKEDVAPIVVAFPVPVNDLCSDALALTLDDGTGQGGILGNTEGASPVNFESCTSSVQPGGLGIWYTVEGTGKPLRVSTCDSNVTESYDTQITLFQGTCESHVCVGDNDNGHDEACGVFSSLTWPSVLGETYILCVHGKFATATDDGDQSNLLSNTAKIVSGTPISGTFSLSLDEMAENDFCETATSIQVNTLVRGTTEDATSDEQVSYCHGTESSAPGVWFRIVAGATGRPLQASVSNTTTNFQLTIYEGSQRFANLPREDCRAARCIAGYDNPFEHDSQVTFATEAGLSYFILVHGVDGQRGSFELTVTETVDNDLCETAMSISLEEPVGTPSNNNNDSSFIAGAFGPASRASELWSPAIHGSTELATFSGITQAGAACDGVVQTGAGVWYTIRGSGKAMRAHTCAATSTQSSEATVPGSPTESSESSLLDTTLTIFRGGNCENLQCLVANDDTCGHQSFVEWESTKDELYHLLISGKAGKKGSFQLQVDSLS